MGKTAFIYPGQGAQRPLMGKDFYDRFPASKEVFDMADNILDIKVTSLCFEENDKLNNTAYTQAAMVTTCLAITKELVARNINPDVTAGLSLGEYAAIAVAGGISYEDAIRIVRKRGIYMEEAIPEGQGAMAAVLGLSTEEIEPVLNSIGKVYIANDNCPGQIVITGESKAVEKAMAELKNAGAKRCIKLQVSGPFHSPFLEEAGLKLGEFMEEIEFNSLRIPYVTNVTAEYVKDTKKIKPLLVKQVSSSVKWQQSIERMIEAGVDKFIEIGPGKTLSGFIKKINPDVKTISIKCVEDIGELAC